MKKLSFPLIFVLLLVSCMFFPFTACGEKEYTMEECFKVVEYDSTEGITIEDLMLPTTTTKNSRFYTANEDVHTRDVIVVTRPLRIISISFYDQYRNQHITASTNGEMAIIRDYKVNDVINLTKSSTGLPTFYKGIHSLVIEFEVL